MIDAIIDFETLGNGSKGAVIDLALITFESDPAIVESFETLVNRGKRIKFSLEYQKGKRLFDTTTMGWWKKQSAEARVNLAPSAHDVDTLTGIQQAIDYLNGNGINKYESLMWCRGMSFDFPLFVDLIRDLQRNEGIPERELNTYDLEPVVFWNQRDIRTAIEALSLVRKMCETPLPKGSLNGFVAHDSVHDCAKDILMLKYAQRYALGLDEVPSEEDADPLSLPKKR